MSVRATIWGAAGIDHSAMQQTWTVGVAERVNARLTELFASRRVLARDTSSAAETLVDAIAQLTLRGGKRLRPCALYAGYLCISDEGAEAATLEAGAALELLQSYLLIQDDWMDGDLERRGGPAVHAAFTAAEGDAHRGASLAMLAGDLACGMAWQLIKDAPFPLPRLREALDAFGQMHWEVVCGQQLDLIEHPDVALVHHLKSGSYSVRGPLQLGAILAGGEPAQLETLARFGRPAGIAFQLRDDLLGTFGDPRRTGKSAGNDLRAGKLTSLIAEARTQLDDDARAVLDAALGNRAATDAEIDAARELLESCGAKARVEQRLSTLLDEARTALEHSPLRAEGIQLLGDLLQRIGSREH